MSAVVTLWLTASLFNAVVDERAEALAPVKQLLIGGEALSVAAGGKVTAEAEQAFSEAAGLTQNEREQALLLERAQASRTSRGH